MRPLSTSGREAVARLAEHARTKGLKPDVVWHSGKLRARQTAETLWRVCNPLASFSAVRGLQPDDPPSWMRDQLHGETRTVVLVGHMPHLPRLLRLLVKEDAIDFPLHGCVGLEETDGGVWKEIWRIDSE